MSEGWKYKALGKLGTLTSSKRIYKKEYIAEGVPFYRSKEIKELANGREISLELFISQERYNEIKSQFGIPQEGDLLLTAVGTIGEMYVVKKNEPDFYFKDGNIMWLKDFETLDPYFLKYTLTLFVEQLKAMSQGSAYKALTIEKLKKYSVPEPSISEQQQIVEILDQAFEAIDQAIANIERNIANAKELFQSKLNDIFSQKGEGWEEKTLIEVSTEFGRGKSKHRPRNDESLYVGDYPFIQTGDIRNAEKYVTSYSKTYNEKGLSQSKLWNKGTLCITIAANIAETAILDFNGCFPDSIIGMNVDEKLANLDYTYYSLQYLKSELQKLGKGSAQDNINLGTFKNLYFHFPKIDTQRQIVESLDEIKEDLNSYEERLILKLKNLDELKKSILQKAFAGELTNKTVEV